MDGKEPKRPVTIPGALWQDVPLRPGDENTPYLRLMTLADTDEIRVELPRLEGTPDEVLYDLLRAGLAIKHILNYGVQDTGVMAYLVEQAARRLLDVYGDHPPAPRQADHPWPDIPG